VIKVIRKTLRDLSVFIEERYSLKASIPLAMVLFLSPYLVGSGFTVVGAVCGCVTVFVALLCLRIADDVSDIDYDKENNGDRALPSGRVDKYTLSMFVYIAMPVIVTVNFLIGFTYGASLVAFAIIYYAYFFKSIKRILPRGVRPFFSNVVFSIIPVYAGILSNNLKAVHIMLALFIYCAAIAHEWAHNVNETERNKNATIIVFAQFTLSGVFGWLFWLAYGKPLVFGITLLITSIQILAMCIRVVANPSHAYARKFYIAGFTFFAIPLIGLIIDNLATPNLN
jgi:4-hydroxybenzoate polyprenyltransferase